jgi:uncharacterized membrane protein YedE/YeeE
MRRLILATIFGIAFGFWLAWTRMTDFNQIVGALLLRHAYLWLMFATGVVTVAVGLQLLRRVGATTVLGRERVTWPTVPPQRRHLVGSILFGAGWALAGACPGPIAAQIGLGRLSSLFTLAGLLLGISVADTLAAASPSRRANSPCAGETAERLA